MNHLKTKKLIAIAGLRLAVLAAAVLLVLPAHAAAPGITGTTFNLVARDAYISQPDGQMIYSWGYGCAAPPSGFAPDAMGAEVAACSSMQIPGPTLIVTEGPVITVTLKNSLPAAAGNTSILFPGLEFDSAPTGGVAGLLTTEAVNNTTVTYTLKTAGKAGTHSYYSGTQGDLQIEMGLYGAIIILPNTTPTPCGTRRSTFLPGDTGYQLASSAYDHSATCYDREYLFQFSEIDPVIHRQADLQKNKACSAPGGCMVVRTENYHAAYFMINGRSMPDNMDPNYVAQFPHQPYNGNPHMHPGELTLLRIVGQGRMQHPFHEHGNHVRVLARDGNLLLSQTVPAVGDKKLAGPLLFTTTTTPGETIDAIFYWTGKGLNWDIYAHGYPGDTSVCIPDSDGYYTSNTSAPNYYEWCPDHNKPLEAAPAGLVGSGGPVTLPDPNGAAAGPWYSGSPYLGPDANGRGSGSTPIAPSGTVSNDPGGEAGFAYMWHSHNEREITTNNIFPGGMMMMMLVDPQDFFIDETK